MIPYANSLDTIGIIANTTHCIATTYQQLIHRPHNPIWNDENDDDDANNHVNDNATTPKNHHIVRDSTQSPLSPQYQESIRDVTHHILSFASTTTSSSTDDFTHHHYDHDNDINRHILHHPTSPPELPLIGLKVGIPETFSIQECTEHVRTVWEDCATWLQQHGATIDVVPTTQISPLLIQQSLASYYILACAEASSNLMRYDGFRYGTNVPMNLHDYVLTDDILNDTNDPTAVFVSILEQQYANTWTQLFGNEVLRVNINVEYLSNISIPSASFNPMAFANMTTSSSFSSSNIIIIVDGIVVVGIVVMV